MVKRKLSVENVFNQVSRFYDFPLIQNLYYGRIQEKLIETIADENPKKILDAGCGTGQLLLKLAETWPTAKLTGLDLSEDMLAKAREKDYPDKLPEFHCASVYEIPMKDKSVDLITNTISSHFYLELGDALDEFYRVLKPRGKLVMANVTNGVLGSLPGPFKESIDIPAQSYRSKQCWLECFEIKGFEVLEVKSLIYPVQLFVCQK